MEPARGPEEAGMDAEIGTTEDGTAAGTEGSARQGRRGRTRTTTNEAPLFSCNSPVL